MESTKYLKSHLGLSWEDDRQAVIDKFPRLALFGGQMCVIGRLKRVNMVQGQQDSPLTENLCITLLKSWCNMHDKNWKTSGKYEIWICCYGHLYWDTQQDTQKRQNHRKKKPLKSCMKPVCGLDGHYLACMLLLWSKWMGKSRTITETRFCDQFSWVSKISRTSSQPGKRKHEKVVMVMELDVYSKLTGGNIPVQAWVDGY